MEKTFILFVVLLISASSFAQKTLDELLQQYNTRSIPYISVEELRMKQINGDVIILDAREENEYQVSHIEGAKFIGFNTFSSESVRAEIPEKETPIIVYCSLGIRSEEIGEKLKKAGFTNVQNLYGGIFEWSNNEYPVINQQEKETDSIHVFSKAWGKWLLKGEKVY
ncbi:MAG: rhodanese-like domain-containing protein [Patiriisocius sp.]|uniref:rhodanese-like domain-containing protein n=1 Tax=Patiriisocius sp. TaxID=2822396 RepID=UPI003EF21B03